MKNMSRFGIGAVLVIGLLATASMVSAVTSVSKCSQIGATKIVKNVSRLGPTPSIEIYSMYVRVMALAWENVLSRK